MPRWEPQHYCLRYGKGRSPDRWSRSKRRNPGVGSREKARGRDEEKEREQSRKGGASGRIKKLAESKAGCRYSPRPKQAKWESEPTGHSCNPQALLLLLTIPQPNHPGQDVASKGLRPSRTADFVGMRGTSHY